MDEIDEVIEEFLVESQEGLDQLDRDLVTLEESPNDPNLLARIFRAAHTIKGTSGFLGFSHLEKLTHAGESLLSRLRDGTLTLTPEITTHLLSMVDAIRAMLDSIRKNGTDGDSDYADLTEALRRAASNSLAVKPVAATPVLVAEPVPTAPAAAVAPADPEPRPEVEAATKPKRKRGPRKPKPAPPPSAPVLEAAPPAAVLAPIVAAVEPAPAIETASAIEPAPASVALDAPVEHGDAAKARAGDARPQPGLETVRVDVALLDSLMDLAGELVLTRNQILQLQSSATDGSLTAAAQRLNLVTLGLQEGIMRMRMQPIDSVLSKFPRMVRDVARACNKLVRLEVDGKNTELDKTLIEAIKDPLTHLIRNAIDHGIEKPEKRLASGKIAEGRVSIRAFHQGGQVHVEISDDGAGISVERVRDKALSKGLVSRERALAMSDSEITNLVFLPGFSTAEALTTVSGRGVGMDVVKTNVERIGGTVEIESRPGRGTLFRIKVPLTLAIVPAVIVACDDARYAIPQVNLVELVLVDSDRGRQRIENVHGAPVYRLRDKLLPLVFLAEQLDHSSAAECFEKRKVHIAVLHAGGRQFGLVVDRVTDSQEIVVKPLAPALKALNVFAGATILGDGRVVLILDVVGLAQRANLAQDGREDGVVSRHHVPARAEEPTQSLLVLRGPDDARIAVPLDRVARLETVPAESLEEAAGRDVVQYGGEIMPIVHLSQLLPERRRRPRHAEIAAPVAPSDLVSLVVLATEQGHVGLAVDDVLDVVDAPLVPPRPGGRAGVLGTLVIHERVTELLDLDWVAAQTGDSPALAVDSGIFMEAG